RAGWLHHLLRFRAGNGTPGLLVDGRGVCRGYPGGLPAGGPARNEGGGIPHLVDVVEDFMLDSKLLRSDPAAVAANLARRGYQLDLAKFSALEERRKIAQVESDGVRAERNANAKAVGIAKGKKEDASALLARAEELTRQLDASDSAINAVQAELDSWQLGLPNLLHESVPEGRDESANKEVRRWGEPR